MPGLVQEIGAVAGLAAVLGLAVLSALYVSHARDVKRLREWAGRASGSAPSYRPPKARPAAWRPGSRHVAVAVVGLVVLGGAAASGVTQLSGGDVGDDSGDARTNDDESAVKPGNVDVAVLNATTVPGLAASLRDQIAAAGFPQGMINDFSDQQLAESVVQYAPGHRAEAKAVGRVVGISDREPVTADTRALAGDATVIVIAGTDKAG